MKKQIITLSLLLFASLSLAQKICIKVGEQFVQIPAQQTQSELKPGWTIVDIKLKDKLTHYLNGGQATQLAEDARPEFCIEPSNKETLIDYAIIKLQKKKYYRKFQYTTLRENKYIRIEPQNFDIKPKDDTEFIVRPLTTLDPGQYVLLNLQQQPIGELQDYIVYPFQVK